MTHGRKPRRPRPVAVNMIEMAIARARKMHAEEIDEVLGLVQQAAKALREGVATEDQWAVLASTVNVAKAIERQGVVRGLQGHFEQAETDLKNVRLRAFQDGSWRPPVLHWSELDHIRTAIELHEFQLKQLGRNEMIRALDYAKAEVLSTGGRTVNVQRSAA